MASLYPYDNHDDWYFNLNEGYCIGLQDPLEDALDQWRRDINRNEVTDNVVNGKIAYYYTYDRSIRMSVYDEDPFDPVEMPTDPLLLDPNVILYDLAISNPNDNTIGDYYLDFWTWWLDMGNQFQDRCVDYTEMNYHYEAMVGGFESEMNSDEDLIRFETGWSQEEKLLPSFNVSRLYQVTVGLIGNKISIASADGIEEAIPLPVFTDLGS